MNAFMNGCRSTNCDPCTQSGVTQTGVLIAFGRGCTTCQPACDPCSQAGVSTNGNAFAFNGGCLDCNQSCSHDCC